MQLNKVYQDKFGGSEAPVREQGNCFQACVATIFNITLEEAFNPNGFADELWFCEFQKWLKPYGLGCIGLTLTGYAGDFGLYIEDRKSTTLQNPNDTHAVVSLMEDDHSCVLHDPNPNSKGLGEPTGIGFIFTIRDPGSLLRGL